MTNNNCLHKLISKQYITKTIGKHLVLPYISALDTS